MSESPFGKDGAMLDIHSHVLPGIDDGSKNAEMSRAMLDESARQGVTLQVATPHFYADRMHMKRFLEDRESAYEQVAEYAAGKGILLLKGAEVAFFRGMSNAEEIEHLTIGATSLLLVEMPFRAWTGHDLDEIDRLIERGFRVVIAHVERFYSFQKDKRIIDELMDMDVYVQCNADPLLHLTTRGKVLQLLKEERVHLIASDSHNLTSRPQNLAAGRAVIEKKLGKEAIQRLDRLSAEIMS